jgi:hypothetical protein
MMADTAMCRGKIPFPFVGVRSLTMIAVGVGIAPMIQVLRGIFRSRDYYDGIAATSAAADLSAEAVAGGEEAACAEEEKGATELASGAVPVPCGVQKIVLLYGVVS